MIDLDAIRQKNEAFKTHEPRCLHEDCSHDHGVEMSADIDALLAEAERLRLIVDCGHQCRECGYRFNDAQGLSLHLSRPGGCPNRSVCRIDENAAFIADIEATYPEEEQ